MFSNAYALTYDLVEYFAKNQHLMKYGLWEDVTVGAHLGFIHRIYTLSNMFIFVFFDTNRNELH